MGEQSCPYCGLRNYHVCCGQNPIRFEMFYDCDEHIWYAVSVKPIRCTMHAHDIHGAIKALFGRIWDNIRLATRRDEAHEQVQREQGQSLSATSALKELFGRDVPDDERHQLYELMREGWC